jgi:hypothetical protein
VQRIIVSAVVLAVVGLLVGYLIFGRVGGEFIALNTLFQTPDNIAASVIQSVSGVKEARQSILISGAVGAGVGVILGAVRAR